MKVICLSCKFEQEVCHRCGSTDLIPYEERGTVSYLCLGCRCVFTKGTDGSIERICIFCSTEMLIAFQQEKAEVKGHVEIRKT